VVFSVDNLSMTNASTELSRCDRTAIFFSRAWKTCRRTIRSRRRSAVHETTSSAMRSQFTPRRRLIRSRRRSTLHETCSTKRRGETTSPAMRSQFTTRRRGIRSRRRSAVDQKCRRRNDAAGHHVRKFRRLRPAT